MTSFLSKAKIPVAAKPLHRFPLHAGHITTGNFMRYDISFASELPKCKIKYNHQSVLRTLALKRPLFGSVQVHDSVIFVPFRTVWEPFTDFYNNVPHNQPAGTGVIPNSPLVKLETIWNVLSDPLYSTASSTTPSSDSQYDFEYNSQYYSFTDFGAWAYSLLVQLGCRVSPLFEKDETISCLPILCAAKAYIDYYYPNAYAHYGVYATIDGIMQRHVTYNLSFVELDVIFKAIYRVAYSDDYFVNAFDNPTGPNSGTSSQDVSIIDISNQRPGSTVNPAVVTDDPNGAMSPNSVIYKPTNGTPYIGGTANAGSNAYALTQYSLDSLRALTNYVRRHQLAGSRSLERYLARWGCALSSDKLRRSIKLAEKHYPVQIGEVMSTSDTYQQVLGVQQGAQLGDYAGRGVGYDGSLNTEFETDEFGYFLVITTIIPDASYVQGLSRHALHKTRLDYLNPEFDGLGTQPILQQELFTPIHRGCPSQTAIFGFTGRYAEYKIPRSCLSGNFVIPTRKTGLLGWEVCRLFSDSMGDSSFNVTHSLDFMLGGDAQQFNRIFLDSEDSSDKFMIVHRHNYELIMPSDPLFDMYDFHDEENHNQVTIDVNGVKSN